MHGNARNQLFEVAGQIMQLYDSTAQKPGAEECEIINVYDKGKQVLIPRKCSGAPTQISNYATTRFAGSVWIIGGIQENKEPCRLIIKVSSDSFKQTAELPFPLYDAAVAAGEKYLIIFGGRTGTKYSNKLLVFSQDMSCEMFPVEEENTIFDLHVKKQLNDWPKPCAQASMTFMENRFYLFGGCGAQPSRELFELELRETSKGIKPQWLNLTRNIGPPPQYGAIFVSYQKALWLFDVKDGIVWRWRGEWRDRGICRKAQGKGWVFDGEVVWFEGGMFQVGCW